MQVDPVRYGVKDAAEPVVHELQPIEYEGNVVPVRLSVRRAEDSTWRGKLIFAPPDLENAPTTAEIFCAVSEDDLWQAVQDLREHHIRDLYRSVSE